MYRIESHFLTLFACLGEYFKAINEESVYILDTFPISACDNYRISRSKRYRGEAYRGYQASKKRYFYGMKVHLLVTPASEPVELFLIPGTVGDLMAHGVEGVSLNEDGSCPDFFQLGDKWVLMGISHEMGCRYYVGEWRNEQFYPELHEQMSWVDNSYFAPESMVAPNGRRIMWAWVFDQLDPETLKAGGWSGVFSLPRELWMGADHRLRMRPVQELTQLRYNERRHTRLMLAPDSEQRIDNIQGNVLELEVVLEPLGATRCGVKVCCAPDGSEETVIGYDRVSQKLFIDTQRSSRQGKGQQVVEAGPFHLDGTELLTLRVLIDKSIVEVYANDRQAAVRRIYPSHPESVEVKLCALR